MRDPTVLDMLCYVKVKNELFLSDLRQCYVMISGLAFIWQNISTLVLTYLLKELKEVRPVRKSKVRLFCLMDLNTG